jgi:hypothetical protein
MILEDISRYSGSAALLTSSCSLLLLPLAIVIPSEAEGPAVLFAGSRVGRDRSLLRKDKRRMNFIHAGPFDSALRAPLRMTIPIRYDNSDWIGRMSTEPDCAFPHFSLRSCFPTLHVVKDGVPVFVLTDMAYKLGSLLPVGKICQLFYPLLDS